MDQYSYYYYGSTSYTSFDGEGQLTSALNYVTGEETKKVYLSTGHGEQELAETITELMNKMDMSCRKLIYLCQHLYRMIVIFLL